MEGDEQKKNGGIELDWDKLLPTKTGGVVEEDPQLVVVPGAKAGYNPTMAVAVAVNFDENENEGYHYEELRRLSDVELNETVKRLRRNVDSMVPKLKDGGKKIIASLKRHEKELERRRCLRLQDDGGCKKPKPLDISTSVDASDSCREGDAPSRSSTQSKFAACFVNKLDENRTESITPDAFYEKRMSSLNRCENFKMRSSSTGPLTSSSGGQKKELSTRETPFRSAGNLSGDTKKRNVSNCDQDICFSASSPCSADAKRQRPVRGQYSSYKRHGNGEHVVLVDEEELEAETMATQENSIGESTNVRIYYPSRDDSEAVEISYSDMECLAPEQYLSSTIMNFYIRYMQGQISSSGTGGCNCHFFNTYFYEKLKEAVMSKSIEDASFVKFRRWWKGVNIFEKAYVLLPIHEERHWSLVIICIPDKDNQSGPIVLHLDSLGFHYSKPIISNIRRFLIEEWRFVKEETLIDLPLAKRVWEKLPRRIDEKAVEVPQQKNDFDCGLFVLFFMKKFIDEAPKRVKNNNFTMFGKKWFKPEEASRLRREIRSLLKGIFEKSQETQISGS